MPSAANAPSPLQMGERAKFRELAGLVLSIDGVSKLEAAVDRAHEWHDTDEMFSLIRTYAAA